MRQASKLSGSSRKSGEPGLVNGTMVLMGGRLSARQNCRLSCRAVRICGEHFGLVLDQGGAFVFMEGLMPRTCTVCRSPRRREIERSMIDGRSNREIARDFKLSSSAVFRHREEHLSKKLLQAAESRELAGAVSLVDRLEELHAETLAILSDARNAESIDNEVALRAISRLEKQVELIARLQGDLKEAPAVALIVSPEWITLRTCILGALNAYPDARLAVSKAIEEAGGLE